MILVFHKLGKGYILIFARFLENVIGVKVDRPMIGINEKGMS